MYYIREGVGASGYIPRSGYHYYRFFDLSPEHSVEFDVLPSSGDPDLYIGCKIYTTGNDAGYPSRSTGHYNFSSDVSSTYNASEVFLIFSCTSRISTKTASSSGTQTHGVAIVGACFTRLFMRTILLLTR
jgi:hypothetical protein